MLLFICSLSQLSVVGSVSIKNNCKFYNFCVEQRMLDVLRVQAPELLAIQKK